MLLGVGLDDDIDERGEPVKKKRQKIIIKDRLGINFEDVFKKHRTDDIALLPTNITNDKFDLRYFLIAAGKKSSDLTKLEPGKSYVDDLVPPAKKVYSVDKFFKKLVYFVEEDTKEEDSS